MSQIYLYNRSEKCREGVVNVMRVRGAYMTIKEFLYTYKKGFIYTDTGNSEQDEWCLKANRKLIIPDYQREYRWEEKQLLELLDDISSGNCYLGQIAISHNIHEPEKYYLVDGQQRITSIIILLTVLCRQFSRVNDTDNLKNFELHFSENSPSTSKAARLNFDANCFQRFQPFISQIYNLNTNDDGSFRSSEFTSPEKDTYNQAERYINACSVFNQAVGKQLDLRGSSARKLSYVKEIINKILGTQISVVLFEGDSSYESEKVFLNINEKGLRLDNEDILKAYYFQSITDNNGPEILKTWTQLKETFFGFQASLQSSKIPLETFVNYTLQTELLMKDRTLNYAKFDDDLRYKEQDGKKHICQLFTDTDLRRSIEWTAEFFKDISLLLGMDANSPFYRKYFGSHNSTTRELFKLLFKSVCFSGMKIIYIALIKFWWLRKHKGEGITLEDSIQLFSFYIFSNVSGIKKEKTLFSDNFISARDTEDAYLNLYISEIQMLREAFSKATTLKQDQEKSEYLSFNIQIFYNEFQFSSSKRQWELSVSNQDFLSKYSSHREKYIKDHFLIQNGKSIVLFDGRSFPINRNMSSLKKRAYNFIYHEDTFENHDFVTRLTRIFPNADEEMADSPAYGKYENDYFRFIKEEMKLFFKEGNTLPTWKESIEKYKSRLPDVFPQIISHILVEHISTWNHQLCKYFESQFPDEIKHMAQNE